MEGSENLLVRIQERMPQLSKGQKRIGQFIMDQYDKAAYITAAKLGEAVGVSESTVVRFAGELGFDGYPGLQRALQAMIRTQLTSVQRMGVASDRMGDGDILSSVLESDMENIRLTLSAIDRDDFKKTIDTLLEARTIYILGARSSASLASFLGFYFNMMFRDARVVQAGTGTEVFEQIYRIGQGDVLFGISFPRYSRRTLKALRFAKDRSATVIGLTDSESSPIAGAADIKLLARSDMASFADSLVAPFSVINALIVGVSMCKKQEIFGTFEQLERVWDEYQVYEKFEPEG